MGKHGDKDAHALRFEHFGRSVLGVAEVDDLVEELGARVTIGCEFGWNQ